MAEGTVNEGRISHRGFASMNAERQRQIASMGGKAVPDEKRSFSQNRRLAAEAGRKGGQSVPGAKRRLSQNRELAANPGGEGAARASPMRSEAPPNTPSLRPKPAARVDKLATEAAPARVEAVTSGKD